MTIRMQSKWHANAIDLHQPWRGERSTLFNLWLCPFVSELAYRRPAPTALSCLLIALPMALPLMLYLRANRVMRDHTSALGALSRIHRQPRLGGLCEQTVGRLVEPLIRTARVIEMTNQLSGQPVDVDPSEIIELRTITVENFSPDYDADVNTLAVEYIAFHRSLLA
jgi:hypothetical protein